MSRGKYDAIIILGGGVGLDGSLSRSATAVLDKAAELYKNGVAGALIVCGSYGYKAIEKPKITEARAYADYLQSLGIPGDMIYQELRSKETLGSILFTKMDILTKHDWNSVLVMPSIDHSAERIDYLLRKILGAGYTWEVLRVGENKDPANLERESRSLAHTKAINDQFADGDHEAIYKGLLESHPAYGGTKWTIDELREELSPRKQ